MKVLKWVAIGLGGVLVTLVGHSLNRHSSNRSGRLFGSDESG
jgi:hypothetical protein